MPQFNWHFLIFNQEESSPRFVIYQIVLYKTHAITLACNEADKIGLSVLSDKLSLSSSRWNNTEFWDFLSQVEFTFMELLGKA